MEEKPKRRLMTMSTGQADPTGGKRPHRLAFRTSQQREVFSMQLEGGKTIQDQLQLTLKTMERSGGWPNIPRLQLRTFIDLLEQDPAEMAA